MGGMKTLATSETRIEALRLQSSAQGVTVAWGRGLNKVPGNLLWYGGFRALPHTETQGGKGGGVRTQSTTYTYEAAVAMAIGEGPILSISKVWRGKKLYAGGYLPQDVATAEESFTISAPTSVTVAHAAAFLAPLAATWVTFFQGDEQRTRLVEGADYTVNAGVYTFNFVGSGTVVLVYQWQGGAPADALQQLGMSMFRGAIGQPVWSHLATNVPAQAIGYSGLAYVAAANYDLGAGAQVENHTFEVQWPGAYTVGPSVPDADPAHFVPELLTSARFGAGLPVGLIGGTQAWSTYARAANLLLSPALTEQMSAAEFLKAACRLSNTEVVAVDGVLNFVPYGDTAVSANGAAYVPNNVPVYDLRDDDFLDQDNPVKVTRRSRADAWNHVRVEFLDRAQQYAVGIAEAEDSAAIEVHGRRSMPIVRAHWICDAQVARNLAQIELQRAQYVLNEYEMRVPWTRALLAPMDLVTVSDARCRLQLHPVRITEVGEGADGDIVLRAEDFPRVAAATQYAQQLAGGYLHDYNAAPGNVLAPVIFEAPGELASPTGLEVYIAVRGAGAQWGGCRVWVSVSGTAYREMAVLYGGSRYGTIMSSLSTGTAVPVAINGGQLVSADPLDAAAMGSLCYIGGATPEYLAYQTATLTGALQYTLSNIIRGAYGTSATAAHASGDAFVRVDDALARSGPLDRSLIGQTLKFKFTSFNIYGAAEQSLADVAEYSYTVVGNLSTRGRVVRGADPITTGNVGVVIAPGALTDVQPVSVESFAVTSIMVESNTYGGGTVISKTVVAQVSGKASVTFEGQLEYTNSDSGASGSLRYWLRNTSVLPVGFTSRAVVVPPGETVKTPVLATRYFDLVAGQTYVFAFTAGKFRAADTATFTNMDLTVEIINA